MKKIGILASYNGSGFCALQEAIKNNLLDAQIVAIVTNNSNAGIIEKAQQYQIPCFIINAKTDYNPDETIANLFNRFEIDHVFLSGYMKKVSHKIFNTFKTINCHPSLLPKFGGQGMYGRFVHEAVFNAREKYSGCTVHFVDENYDEGAIILQKTISIDAKDNPQTIEEKVKSIEKLCIVEAFRLL